MIKSSDRKILWVLLFCFVSTVVCGVPANAFRNDLSLLLSKSSDPVLPLVPHQSGLGQFFLAPFQSYTYIDNQEWMAAASGLTHTTFRNVPGFADIVQSVASPKSVCLPGAISGQLLTSTYNYSSLTSLPSTWLALGYFKLVLNLQITQSV